MKNSFYLFIGLLVVALAGCDGGQNNTRSGGLREVSGEAQGTTYSVLYSQVHPDFQPQFDSILDLFDQEFSLWQEGSLINRFNAHDRTDQVFEFFDSTKYWSIVFDVAKDVWSKTDGAFDPSVYPLLQGWGFGLDKRRDMTPEVVDSLLQIVGFSESQIVMEELEEGYLYKTTWIRKKDARAQVTFDALAQGFAADLLADFLEMNDIHDYMVELGGEVVLRGYKPDGTTWRLGIDKPEATNAVNREIMAALDTTNCAVVTSGSYRKFYEENGKKYSHTINPKTGYPVDHNLLSATVVASTGIYADAYATAFMVLGLQTSIEFLQEYPDLGLEAYFIFDDNGEYKTLMTEGLEGKIRTLEELASQD